MNTWLFGAQTLQDVVRKGSAGLKKIVSAFGEEILLQSSGELDRARLGEIIFSDPEKRRVLNRLLAPYISRGIVWEVVKLWLRGCEVVVLDIPLLFETKMNRWTNPVIVVWIDGETQRRRLMERDGISWEQARNRIDSQMSLEWKKANADVVIDNSGSMEDTKLKVGEVVQEITRPLTWKEAGMSRNGCLIWVLGSGIIAFLAYSIAPFASKSRK